MTNIVPIIVQRQRFDGTQQIITYPMLGNNQVEKDYLEEYRLKKNKHHTLQQKKQNVRIRRVQSSGNKRKLPKDFFSKEPNKVNSQKPMMNGYSGRVSRTAESVCRKRQRQQKCFETPKFRDKFLEVQKKYDEGQEESIKKIPLNLKPKINEASNKNLIFMENTFAGNSFDNQIKENANLELKKIQKQNLPKKKIKTPRQIHAQKFSLIKQKTTYFRLRNIFQ